jgi:hypothetical protein
VLVTRAPYAGQIGTLSNILLGLSVLPSGIKAQAAEIRLENGDNVVVPLTNLEVLV